MGELNTPETIERLENRVALLEKLLKLVDVDKLSRSQADQSQSSEKTSSEPVNKSGPDDVSKAAESNGATGEATSNGDGVKGATTTTEEKSDGAKDDEKLTTSEKDKEPDKDKVAAETSEKAAPRYELIVAQWDEVKQKYVDEDGTESLDKKKNKKKPVITYRKKVGGEDGKSEIIIEDKNLLRHLRNAIASSSHDWSSVFAKDSLTVTAPFLPIVWYWDELTKAATEADGDGDETTLQKQDLRKLLEYVQETSEMADYFKTRKDKPDSIAYRHIWTLLRPGEILVGKLFLNTPQLFRVGYVVSEWSLPQITEEKWHFGAVCYDHNGYEWVRAYHSFEFKRYDHEKPINSLTCYPLQYHGELGSDAPELLAKQRMEEGEKFVKIVNLNGSSRMKKYHDFGYIIQRSGGSRDVLDAMERDVPDNIESRPKQEFISGEVILDAQAWYQQYNTLELGTSAPYSLWNERDEMSEDKMPVDPTQPGNKDWIKFCPPRCFGYATRDKNMAQLRVQDMQNMDAKDDTLFEQELQLSTEHKTMLRGLIEHQVSFTQEQKSATLLDTKGNGLVILLHGPPGTGKTLTAETVAKATGKPLLPASAAEIGLHAEHAQERMQRIFDRAQRWDAILLLDEADAFLESRTEGYSSDRNALVAVMLRILEYYTGIIILTTNRLMVMDPALQSRIHLAIFYDDLSPDQRLNIFKNTLTKFNVSQRTTNELGRWFKKQRIEELNGRETRNIVRSAVGLARSRGADEEVNEDDCDKVLDVSLDFRKRLRDVYVKWKNENQGVSRGSRRM